HLYGHALPALSVDFSDDGELLATGGADKCVKVWGLDFGDCRTSIGKQAWDDSLMQLRFARGTHHIWTVSKDGTVRMVDADAQQVVTRLDLHRKAAAHTLGMATRGKAHLGAVWSLALAHDGSFLVTCGADRALRVWGRTEELTFARDEAAKQAEREHAQQDERELLSQQGGIGVLPGLGEELAAQQQATSSSDPVSVDAGEALRHGERLLREVEAALQERRRWQEYHRACDEAREEAQRQSRKRRRKLHKNNRGLSEEDAEQQVADAVAKIPKPERNLLYYKDSPHRSILQALAGVSSADLEQTLLTLPFDVAAELLEVLRDELRADDEPLAGEPEKADWSPRYTELALRVLFFVLRAHRRTLCASRKHLELLRRCRDCARRRLREMQGLLGGNLAALQAVRHTIKQERMRV
ncbi:MAG: hypothetical protein MHM6MM_008462, partial [Cercozoa sp. M6MM]